MRMDQEYSLMAIKPLTTKQFQKGYIDILDGNSSDELFVHVYLYGQMDKSLVKRFVDSVLGVTPDGSTVAGEFIPELLSICLVITKKDLALAKNLMIKKVSEAIKGILDPK